MIDNIKAKNVLTYYVLCNKLKNVIRTGWKDWHVKRKRLESVAEHIYGTQMLAIAMKQEFEYDIDLEKVVFMLAIHETGEAIIGDLTQFQISKEEKYKIEIEAVRKIFSNILNGDKIESYYLEFEEQKTKEAMFANQCDHLECDIQAKLYGEDNCVNLKDQEDNGSFHHPKVQELLQAGNNWEEMWIKFGQQKYNYGEHFRTVSDYILNNELSQDN